MVGYADGDSTVEGAFTTFGVSTALALLALDPHLGGVAVPAPGPEQVEEAAGILAGYCAALYSRSTPVERLPLSADLAALTGGIDLSTSIMAGRLARRAGIIERARGGLLLVPFPDLLSPGLAGPLHTALKGAGVRLVLGHDPYTQPKWPGLIELCGLLPAPARGDERACDAAVLPAARRRFPAVRIGDDQIAALAAAALELGLGGWRADALAARAAKAHAALHGRDAVADDDLLAAVTLVLAPRATRRPAADQTPRQQSPHTGETQTEVDDGEREQPDRGAPQPEMETAAGERLIAALRAHLPEAALRWPDRPGGPRRPVPGAAGRSRGDRAARPVTRAAGGRPGGAFAGERRPAASLLDPAATLIAALPRQLLRRQLAAGGPTEGPADGTERRILLRPEDLRWRRRQVPPGVLFLLAVDASGSMARNRLAQAKGAALLLLERAYRYRDRAALLAFRGKEATLLLPPTRATARAGRLIQLLPAGGGTPLASALQVALDTHRNALRQGFSRVMLVLMTDGRGNVPLAEGGDAHGDVAELAATWSALVEAGDVAVLVVDTRAGFLTQGEAQQLAHDLSARYLYLPTAAPAEISQAAQELATARGWRV